MDAPSIVRYIVDTFPGTELQVAAGDTFFFRGSERMFPFATLVTSNAHDAVSDLDRQGVFRLNVGVTKQTFQSLFSDPTVTHDFAALDRIMPHPVYGNMHWICVLSPSDATFEAVKPMLAEAFELSGKRYGAG